MKQLIQDIGKEIRRIAVAAEGFNAKISLIISSLDNLVVSGAGGAAALRQYLLDDSGRYLLDDSGNRIYFQDDAAEVEAGGGVVGNYHFIPINRTAGTHALLPATPGVYYKVTFVFLSSTLGDTSWKLHNGNTFQTGYTAGDVGFGAVIPLAENLFTTTAGNALNLVVTGAGTIQGHLVVYSYGD